jgi:hypothetical protein
MADAFGWGSNRGVWTPASRPDLAFWLDNSLITESSGKVTAWPDSSGLGRHFPQANPALQPNYVALETDFPVPQPAVKFNVADSVLAVASAFALRWVAIVAVYPAATFAVFNGLFTGSFTNDRRAFVGSSGSANWLTDGLAGNRYRGTADTDVALTTANTPQLYIHTFNASETWTWQVGKDRGNAGRQWNDSVGLVFGGSAELLTADIPVIEQYCRTRGLIL